MVARWVNVVSNHKHDGASDSGNGNPVAVVFFGMRVAMLLRPATTKNQTDNIDDTCAVDLTRNFEEMRISNDISDAEFRTIKSVLEKKHADSIGQ